MSNLVFLIGNGFDLNCGLKSKYKDAYQYYCNKTQNNSELIERFKNDLKANYENWSDFEEGMAYYASKLSDENELIECIRDFRKKLKEYLINEEIKLYDFINSDNNLIDDLNAETKKSINKFFEGVSNNVSRKVNNINKVDFVSFNYTSVLDNLARNYFNQVNQKMELKCSNYHVTHIHSSFNSTPALGIDRIEQLSVPYKLTLKGKRTFIKPFFNTNIDNKRILDAESLIFSANYLCLFGLSLGISDLSWRDKIIEWLTNDSEHQLFIYNYSLYKKINLDDDERLDEEEECKNKLFTSWNIKSTEQLLEQVHMPCGNKIFNYIEIINQYLIKKKI